MTEQKEASGAGELLSLTAEIVSSHVTRNHVDTTDVAGLIRVVHQALAGLSQPQVEEEPALEPAVPVRRSITPDYIICLEDGRKLKMLKRHLMTAYGMTPDQYRAKWGLQPDYPMVAPNYARRRQELAVEIGLGRKRKGA